METSLFTLATILVIFLLIKSSNRGWLLTSAALGLLPLIRPEGFLLIGLVFLLWFANLLRAGHNGAYDFRRLALQAAVAIPLATSYFLISFLLSGEPLPNTFYARTRLWGCEFGPSYFSWLASEFLLDAAVGVFLSLLGIAAYVKRFAVKGGNCAMAILPLWVVGLPLANSLIAPCTSIYYSRYSVPLAPVMALFAAIGFSSVRSRLPSFPPNRGSTLRTATASALAIAALFGSLLPTTSFWATHYGRSVRDIQMMHAAIGRWLNSNSERGSLIALNDIGAIGYFSERRVFDLVGLVSPEVLPSILDKGPGEWDGPLTSMMRKEQPDYLVVFPKWYPEMVDALPLEKVYSIYIEDPAIVSGKQMVVYKFLWQ
jgi:hypothetical protein